MGSNFKTTSEYPHRYLSNLSQKSMIFHCLKETIYHDLFQKDIFDLRKTMHLLTYSNMLLMHLNLTVSSLPVSLWASFLDLLAFWSPFTAQTVDTSRASNSLWLQSLWWLLECKLNCFAFFKAAKTFHVQLALKNNIGKGSALKMEALDFEKTIII